MIYTADELNNTDRDELIGIILSLQENITRMTQNQELILEQISILRGQRFGRHSEKMNVISKDHQIICITHLPQIAAMADTHFLIEKQAEKNHTSTNIRKLNETESVTELGRMLGGVKITDTVLKSAKEMKELAAVTKNTDNQLT